MADLHVPAHPVRIVTASADRTARIWDARTGAELLQRYGGRMGEGGVGLGADVVDGLASQFVAGEARQDLGGDLGVGTAGEGGDLFGGELRPLFRHVEPAVGGEARQHRVDKADRRGAPPCGDVPHHPFHFRQRSAA